MATGGHSSGHRRPVRADLALLDMDLGGETVFPISEMLDAMGVPYIFKRASLLGRRNLAAYRRFSLRDLVLMDPLEITASDDVHERAS